MATAALAAMSVAASLSSCDRPQPASPRVIVLGFDGMDPRLCERLMDAGELPNLSRMRDAGGYRPLATSIPPQSPVAWASFITGANPGVHGIFDFIHRDPSAQCLPYYSSADTLGGEEGWEIGEHKIPLSFWPFQHEPARTRLRRGGVPFWDFLDEAGIPVWLYDIPANYPPSPSTHGHMHCLSGMGVPDLLGGYGTYQFFDETLFAPRDEDGGIRKPAMFVRNAATAVLTGPQNTSLQAPAASEVPFSIYRHPTEPIARIEIQGQTIVLAEGEWSEWRGIDFELTMPPFMPNAHVSGICRFYLQQVRPKFRLYVTPINIDPADTGGQQLTEPKEFAKELADELGPFYTAGFQEDHKALSNGVFNDEEYRRQADYVLSERLNLREFALDHYDGGLLFFYFSSTDLQAHMFWWDAEEKHPVRTPDQAKKYNGVIADLYRRMDAVVGDVLERAGETATVLVMSDHGFGNFRRQFNLNTWLRNNGYVLPRRCRSLLDAQRGTLVDWSRTKAYGLGLNGLYVNLAGRERDGVVDPAQRAALLDELSEKLLAVTDPATGRKVIKEVYRSDDIYTGPLASTAPDLIIGYHRGYRSSWATALGDITDEVLLDNDSAWSADHCIAADEVPGVIFANKPIRKRAPSLLDLAPTILEAFGVTVPATMEGASLFQSTRTARVNTANKE